MTYRDTTRCAACDGLTTNETWPFCSSCRSLMNDTHKRNDPDMMQGPPAPGTSGSAAVIRDRP